MRAFLAGIVFTVLLFFTFAPNAPAPIFVPQPVPQPAPQPIKPRPSADCAMLAARVADSLDALETWLSSSQYADQWDAYLGNAKLHAELLKVQDADLAVVLKTLAMYTPGVVGADGNYLPEFSAVRNSLATWAASLDGVSPVKMRAPPSPIPKVVPEIIPPSVPLLPPNPK